MNGILGAIEELKSHLRECAEADSSNLSRLQESLTSNWETNAGFLSGLVMANGKVGPAVVEALEPLFRDFGILQEGIDMSLDNQAAWLMALSGSMKGLPDTLAKAQGSTVNQGTLDELKDVILEGLEAVVVKAQPREPSGETRVASAESEKVTARLDSIEAGVAELRKEFAESRRGIGLVLSKFEEVLDQHGSRVDKLKESSDRLPDSVSRLFTHLEWKIDRFRTGWRLLLSPGVILLLVLAVLFESTTATVRRLLW